MLNLNTTFTELPFAYVKNVYVPFCIHTIFLVVVHPVCFTMEWEQSKIYLGHLFLTNIRFAQELCTSILLLWMSQLIGLLVHIMSNVLSLQWKFRNIWHCLFLFQFQVWEKCLKILILKFWFLISSHMELTSWQYTAVNCWLQTLSSPILVPLCWILNDFP